MLKCCYFAEDGTNLFIWACCTCSTIIFPHSTNQILNLWLCRCRCRSCRWCQNSLMTFTLHVISATTDVIQLVNNTHFFFQPMKLEHLAVGVKIAPFLSCSRVQARNFPTPFVTSGQVGQVFIASAFYIPFSL